MRNPLIDKYHSRFESGQEGRPLPYAEAAELFQGFQKLDRRLARIARISDGYQAEIKLLVEELQAALDNVRVLKGCIPICASCKKVRSDAGYWKQLEQYLAEHSELLFSHGLCPDCASSYLAQSQGSGRPAAVPQAPVGEPLLPEDFDDPVLSEFLPLVNHADFAGMPLAAPFSRLFRKYVRLSRRLNRIARISDNYQANLQELKIRLDLSAHSDYLTGLPNRREIYTRLAEERSRTMRHGKVFALVMFDFDDFKQINDSFGHAVGDQVLVAAARTLNDQLRREDSCGRWGGDEFLLLLPETGVEQAMVVAEKVRRLIEKLGIAVGDTLLSTSVSLGVAVFRAGEAVDNCVARADAGLYRAKQSGRNRAIFLAPED